MKTYTNLKTSIPPFKISLNLFSWIKKYIDEKISTKPQGQIVPSEECWIDLGEMHCFHDVYKIMIGKTTSGDQYRITEFSIIGQSDSLLLQDIPQKKAI